MSALMPWLSVSDAGAATRFYVAALGARIDQSMEAEGVLQVARLSVGEAQFWVQQDDDLEPSADPGRAVRLVLTVPDPDRAHERAISEGAVSLATVHDEHGWRTGRFRDPFGHQWETARSLH